MLHPPAVRKAGFSPKGLREGCGWGSRSPLPRSIVVLVGKKAKTYQPRPDPAQTHTHHPFREHPGEMTHWEKTQELDPGPPTQILSDPVPISPVASPGLHQVLCQAQYITMSFQVHNPCSFPLNKGRNWALRVQDIVQSHGAGKRKVQIKAVSIRFYTQAHSYNL